VKSAVTIKKRMKQTLYFFFFSFAIYRNASISDQGFFFFQEATLNILLLEKMNTNANIQSYLIFNAPIKIEIGPL